VALLLVLAALALRLYHIDAHGLWNDEGLTARYASLPVGHLVATIAADDPHPPLYYLVIHVWGLVAGPTDFAIRLPSALFGALTVAALYALGRRIGGRATATLAALFAAASPLLVWYDQEARMYALLVLGATVSTLLLHRARQRGAWSAWVLHAAVLATTLHVHYFAAFLAAWHGLLVERATRWRPDRWRALLALALAAGAFVPWLLSTQTLGYQGWMEPVDFENALRRAAWAFAVGTSIYPEWGWLLSAPMLAAAALGTLALALRRPRADLWLIAGWAVVPVLASYTFGALTGRPSFHERYVIAGTPAVLLLAALGITALAGLTRGAWGGAPKGARGALAKEPGERVQRDAHGAVWPTARALASGATAITLTAGILLADTRSLLWHFTDPHFAKEDVRAAARFIDARADPTDGLLAAPGRADLYNRYKTTSLDLEVTDVAPHELEPLLESFVRDKPRLWYLPHDADIDRQAELWLDARAYRLDDRWFGLAPLKSWLFATDPPGAGATATLTRRDTAALRVTSLRHAVEPTRDGHVARIVADWTRLTDLPSNPKASLRLLDSRERTVVQRDFPIGGELSPIDARPADQPRTLRFALRVPPDVPGGTYSLRLVVYADEPLLANGEPVWRLGDVPLTARPGTPAQIEPNTHADGELGPLRLIGHDLPTAEVAGGGKATAVLHWHALEAAAWPALAESRIFVGGFEASAGADPETIAGAAAGPGAVLREARDLRLPRELSTGTYALTVRLGSRELAIGRIAVAEPVGRPMGGPTFPAEATFGPADLVGFDAKGEVRPAGRVAIGLHFAPRQPFQRDLKVFVHLLDEAGKIVAQHDGQPCGGGCPTSAWRGGERIVSEHPLELPSSLPPGQYAVVVGLYDGRTGDRIPRAGPTPPGQSDRAILGNLTVAA
jgi:mannosyltransferase